MAVTATLYNSFKKKIVDGTNIDLDSDTIKVAAVTSSYTPDIDVHDFWNDIVANEATGTGYTAGGATLGSVTLAVDTSTDLAKFDAADTSWTISSAFSARYFVIYKSTGTDSTSPLIGYIDNASTISLSSGTVTITYSASGILTLT